MSDKKDTPVRSRADSILAEINPQQIKKPLSVCPKCGSDKVSKGGGLGEMLMFRCHACRHETPLGHTGIPTQTRLNALPFAPPVSGPYDGDVFVPPDKGAPGFRGRGTTYKFEDDE
jgi:hypothetical protein